LGARQDQRSISLRRFGIRRVCIERIVRTEVWGSWVGLMAIHLYLLTNFVFARFPDQFCGVAFSIGIFEGTNRDTNKRSYCDFLPLRVNR
jgi:hypothetical protein